MFFVSCRVGGLIVFILPCRGRVWQLPAVDNFLKKFCLLLCYFVGYAQFNQPGYFLGVLAFVFSAAPPVGFAVAG
jgi:hypothetical protein